MTQKLKLTDYRKRQIFVNCAGALNNKAVNYDIFQSQSLFLSEWLLGTSINKIVKFGVMKILKKSVKRITIWCGL